MNGGEEGVNNGVVIVIIIIILLLCVIGFIVWDPGKWFCTKPQEDCEKRGDCCGKKSRCIAKKCCLDLGNTCKNSTECCNKNICDDKDKKCVKPTPTPSPTPTPGPAGPAGPAGPSGAPEKVNYKPPFKINGINVPTNDTCNDLEWEWVRLKGYSIPGTPSKLCNVYYNGNTNRRCSPGPQGAYGGCIEGPKLPTSIQCSELRSVRTPSLDYQGGGSCNTIKDIDVKVSKNWAFDGNTSPDYGWNQGLCEAYHDGEYICEGSPMGSGHPCVKSSTKKCYN